MFQLFLLSKDKIKYFSHIIPISHWVEEDSKESLKVINKFGDSGFFNKESKTEL